ncbi:Gfo/Idh/MocA family oxidoreductase [Raineyella sp. W15-4]|uniref:Gfo/Idh/MocA family protein n=1 Tax=Raineyella sp. W15-4 TaxID=3081651 RepID=UPI002953A434|nr:Gfo/Idh/MocA family oxidoreductase [Raineyella sp. W15-4]WOQ17102.1 Gfo/Idh/MocA family oxidoreductase [Raineyella sp. W15-4]
MQEKRTIRVAVVGAGQAGQAHAFGFRNAAMTDRLAGVEVRLATLVDPNTELAEKIARRYGFERVAADVQDVIDDPSIEVVSVALPTFLSLPVVGSLLRAGKHVLAEKPLGRNGAEADELAGIAKESGKVAAVGYSYRRIPALAQLREVVRDGRIGTPYFARGQFFADYALDPQGPMVWRYDQQTSGGGVVLDMGTHVIDALEYILGPIAEVSSSVFDITVKERPTRDGSLAPVTNDDTSLINVRFGDGALGTILSSRVAAGATIDLGFEIFGSKGHVKYSFGHMNEWTLYQTDPEDKVFDGPRVIQPGLASPHVVDTVPMAARGNAAGWGEAFIAEMQEFLTAVVHGEEIDTSFEVAAQTMHVVDAAFESARTHRPVAIPAAAPATPIHH